MRTIFSIELLRDRHRKAALFVAAAPAATGPFGNLLDQYRSVAVRAWSWNWFVPSSKLTIRITITAVEHFAPARFTFFHVPFAAVRALDAKIHRFFQRTYGLTFGIAATAEKLAVLAPTKKHRPAAVLAAFVDLHFFSDFEFAVLIAAEIFGAFAFRILRAG